MPNERAARRQELRRRRGEGAVVAGNEPAAPASRRTPMWLIAIAAFGGAALAGTVVLEMKREKPAPKAMPQTVMPMSSMPPSILPVTTSGSGSATPFTPQPGEAPPGKVWSPEHGHWHDAPK